MKLGVFYHPGFAAPLGQHIMPIGKFALVAEALRGAPDIELLEPSPVTALELGRVHTGQYIEAVRTGVPRELAESQKFPWSADIFPSVCLTNGACVSAAKRALEAGVSAALASGFHHACSDHGEGFCTFNGLVVALEELFACKRIRAAAVLDMDLHYGNGTAQLAAARPWLFAVSVYGNDFLENRPYRDVSVLRHKDGENHRSLPLPAGCDRKRLLDALHLALELIAARRPEILLYQAGADPYFEDPFSPLALGFEDLQERDRVVFEFARREQIPVAWGLAGGYTEDIRKIVRIHVNTFEAARSVFGG